MTFNVKDIVDGVIKFMKDLFAKVNEAEAGDWFAYIVDTFRGLIGDKNLDKEVNVG